MGAEDPRRLSPLGAETPNARGVMLCLHKLAEEAADLGLSATQAAIRDVIEICRHEVVTANTPQAH